MATSFEEVITNYGLVAINDMRLYEELEANPALFFRKMAQYMVNAIPLFNRPPEIVTHLVCLAPQYDDYQYTVPSDASFPVTLETGKLDYELCCVTILGTDEHGNPEYTEVTDFVYDSETGNLTLNTETAEGTVYDINFYTDGKFVNELAMEVKMILGECLHLVWEQRFSASWLDRAQKPRDKTFDLPNEANWTRAQMEKAELVRQRLNGLIYAFEQRVEYNRVFPRGRTMPTVVSVVVDADEKEF